MNLHKKANETKAELNKASEHIIDATNKINKKAQKYTDELVDCIEESPIKSVLIAAAVGLLIGKLFL